jgi:translation initiation factor 2 subunit 2
MDQQAIENVFKGLKKKKKVVEQLEALSLNEEEEQVVEEVDQDQEGSEATDLFGDLKKKKKKDIFGDLKKKKKKRAVELDDPVPSVEPNAVETEGDYTYQELLTRVFTIIKQNNPDFSGDSKSYKIVPPQVLREGTKKTAFANILDIAKRMRRPPDHVIQFLFAELGTSGSIDGTQRLVIKGRFQQKQIETVLKRYIGI